MAVWFLSLQDLQMDGRQTHRESGVYWVTDQLESLPCISKIGDCANITPDRF